MVEYQFMKHLLLTTTKMIFLIWVFLTFSCASDSRMGWEKNHGWGEKELYKLPEVEILSIDKDRLQIEVTNSTHSTLYYVGGSPESPSLYFSVFENGEWVNKYWDFCGVGLKIFVLNRGEQIQVELNMPDEPVRVYMRFTHIGDYRTWSFVKLFEYRGSQVK